MASYRCGCPHCTAYIRSAPEPYWRDAASHAQWEADWQDECREFLALPCDEHWGYEYENARQHELLTGREEKFARLQYVEAEADA